MGREGKYKRNIDTCKDRVWNGVCSFLKSFFCNCRNTVRAPQLRSQCV